MGKKKSRSDGCGTIIYFLINSTLRFWARPASVELSTLLGERVVDGVGALIVGMSLHLETGTGVLLHIVGDLLNLSHRLGLQRSLAGLEEDVVGHELTRLGNGLLDGGHRLLVAFVECHPTLGQTDIGDWGY